MQTLPGELETLNFVDFARHLWRRRYILIGVPVLAVIAGYFIMRQFVGETFEASATILVRTPPTDMLPTPPFSAIETPVYEHILLSDELLLDVVEQTRAKFPGQFPKDRFEKLKKQFSVKIMTTVDTSVSTKYAPVLVMRVTAGTREITHFMMTRWLESSVERFGKMRTREGQAAEAAFRARFAELSSQANALQANETRLDEELRDLSQQLEARSRLLSGTAATAVSTESRGLVHQLAEAEIQLAEAQAAGPAGAAEAARLEARIARIRELIARTTEEMRELRGRKAEAETALEAARKDLIAVRESLAEVRLIMNRVASDAILVPDPYNPGVAGDFSVLSRPVMPETRIAPARAAIALVIGLAVGLILLGIFLVEWFVSRAILEPAMARK